MSYSSECTSVDVFGSAHAHFTSRIKQGDASIEISSDESVKIDQQHSPDLGHWQWKTREQSKSDTSYETPLHKELEVQNFIGIPCREEQEFTPLPEMDTPALTYLATPSSTFSLETPLLDSPEYQVNRSSPPTVYTSASATPDLATYSGSDDSKYSMQSMGLSDALGLFHEPQEENTSAHEHDGFCSEENTVYYDAESRLGDTSKNKEEMQSIFFALWRSRKAKDCVRPEQAKNPCYLNATDCPSCDSTTLVGSYQRATTMKRFPQGAIHAFLKGHSKSKFSKLTKEQEKKIEKSLAETGSAYPLSGTLPFLHPVTTIEVCLLCTTQGCNTKEIRKLGRSSNPPLTEAEYRVDFADWLEPVGFVEETGYDSLFDEPDSA